MGLLKKKAKASEKAKAGVGDYGIILEPLVTEKSSTAVSHKSRVVFRVKREMSKLEVRAAVERVFGVKVDAVRTCNYMGKSKRSFRSVGRRAHFKKAYVTLAEGSKIDLIEGL